MPPKGKKPEQKKGTFFPKDEKGERGSTFGGKQALAAALRGAGEDGTADKVAKASGGKWRFGYNNFYMSLVKAGCKSPEAALGSAEAGLEYMYSNFEHIKNEGEAPKPFKAYIAADKDNFATGVVKGEKPKGKLSYVVPYDGGWSPARPKAPPAGSVLSGDSLKAKATAWANEGIVEPDATAAIHWTADYFEKGQDLSDCHFVLIGAGSAMGPCSKLLECGAHVVALDIPGAWGKGTARPATGVWTRLFGLAKASSGTLTYPKDANAAPGTPEEEAAGADLMSCPAQIANWLAGWSAKLPKTAKVCIGNYTYLDGELHVKLALCADACIQRLIKARAEAKASPPTVAFLCTPTDIHVCPAEANRAARKNAAFYHPGYFVEKLVQVLTMGKKLVPNALKPVGGLYLCDGLSVAQGPNYALAKRMQHWRAMIAYDGGCTVSSMVAPSTATESVIHNKTFAWAYGGMPFFKFEIFKQETTNAVMCALLLHDVLNEGSPKNPKNRAKLGLANTLELFKTQSVHGGLWRAPYKVDSLGEMSALIYFLGGPKLFLPIMLLLTAALVYGVVALLF